MSVIDASVAVKWLYDEPESDLARRVLASESQFSAPALWLIECAAVLTRKARAGTLSQEEVSARVAFLRALPVELHEDADLLSAGLALSVQLKQPLYDCLYLALARRTGSRLILADYDFAKTLQGAGYAEDVVELRNYGG